MFEAAGVEASKVLGLFWPLLAGAAVIWLLVVGGTFYAMRIRPERHSERFGRRLILIGGVIAPTLILAGIAVASLRLMADLRTAPADFTIRVTGEQFWWRVQYLDGQGRVTMETANEIALPNGSAVELELRTRDVIHSFWVPALAGKLDMVPGMVNRLLLEPRRTGTYRGQCAEFCGESHALMAFRVRVMEPAEYRIWLEHQRTDAPPPAGEPARRGHDRFLGYGCGACHSVRGTPATGGVGPDLTHLASRARIGAETLRNDHRSLARWLESTDVVKPGVRMPAFGMLPAEDLELIASYLEGLE
ncbi:MAG TPA: cytochrome c oxidase subunit II [Pseudomonadales bacterium]